MARTKPKMPPVHPGELLLEDFLKPEKITAYGLAKAIGVPPPRVYDIVKGKRAITADTALRLAKALGTSAELWLNLQAHYDLELARDAVGDEIEATVKSMPSFGAVAIV